MTQLDLDMASKNTHHYRGTEHKLERSNWCKTTTNYMLYFWAEVEIISVKCFFVQEEEDPNFR